MRAVLLIAAAPARKSASSYFCVGPSQPKTSQPTSTQPRICAPAVSVMTRPALNIFFRSISSPIMNSSSDRPISEIVLIESGLVTHLKPFGPTAKPATRYASSNGCRAICDATATTHAAMMQMAMSVTSPCSMRGKTNRAFELRKQELQESNPEGRVTRVPDFKFGTRGTRPSENLTQRVEHGLCMRELVFPFHQALLVFGEDGGRNFLRKIRVRQLLFHLHDFSLVFLDFLREVDLLGCGINQTFERQK